MTKLPDYLFVSSTDGALHDTRKANWHTLPPLRPNYERHHRTIESAADFKATIRAGRGVWPGGYELAFITSDGALLCFDCARKHARHVLDSVRSKSSDGWRVVATTYEACDVESTKECDEDLISHCDQCNKEFGELA